MSELERKAVKESAQNLTGPIYQTCKDHTVSGKKFDLVFDEEREMLITTPKPEKSEISGYYQSEDYISHTDSSKTFIDKIYQNVKKFMLQKKLRWIEKKIPAKGKILDIGAGTGDFLVEAEKRGWKIEGVEPSDTARANAQSKGVKLHSNTEEFKSHSFDVITMWHVFEHIYDLKAQIVELEHLLKKDGLLIIAVPNFNSYDAKYYKEFWAAYDVPRHLWHFSRRSFQHLFSGTGFKLSDSKPLIFDSFYVSFLSEKYKTGKTKIFHPLWIGLRSNITARSTSEYSSVAYFFRKTD